MGQTRDELGRFVWDGTPHATGAERTARWRERTRARVARKVARDLLNYWPEWARRGRRQFVATDWLKP